MTGACCPDRITARPRGARPGARGTNHERDRCSRALGISSPRSSRAGPRRPWRRGLPGCSRRTCAWRSTTSCRRRCGRDGRATRPDPARAACPAPARRCSCSCCTWCRPSPHAPGRTSPSRSGCRAGSAVADAVDRLALFVERERCLLIELRSRSTSPCRSATLLAMSWPFLLYQGPAPMRSRAFTAGWPLAAVALRYARHVRPGRRWDGARLRHLRAVGVGAGEAAVVGAVALAHAGDEERRRTRRAAAARPAAGAWPAGACPAGAAPARTRPETRPRRGRLPLRRAAPSALNFPPWMSSTPPRGGSEDPQPGTSGRDVFNTSARLSRGKVTQGYGGS